MTTKEIAEILFRDGHHDGIYLKKVFWRTPHAGFLPDHPDIKKTGWDVDVVRGEVSGVGIEETPGMAVHAALLDLLEHEFYRPEKVDPPKPQE